MKIRKCNLCGYCIQNDDGASFGCYDLCIECVHIVRRVTCRKCKGTGRVSEVDQEASAAQATCGENRTQYKTVDCLICYYINEHANK